MLSVRINHKAFQGREERGKGGMAVGGEEWGAGGGGGEGDYIPIATLSPPE